MVDGQDLERLILWRAEVNGLNFTYFIFPSFELSYGKPYSTFFHLHLQTHQYKFILLIDKHQLVTSLYLFTNILYPTTNVLENRIVLTQI